VSLSILGLLDSPCQASASKVDGGAQASAAFAQKAAAAAAAAAKRTAAAEKRLAELVAAEQKLSAKAMETAAKNGASMSPADLLDLATAAADADAEVAKQQVAAAKQRVAAARARVQRLREAIAADAKIAAKGSASGLISSELQAALAARRRQMRVALGAARVTLQRLTAERNAAETAAETAAQIAEAQRNGAAPSVPLGEVAAFVAKQRENIAALVAAKKDQVAKMRVRAAALNAAAAADAEAGQHEHAVDSAEVAKLQREAVEKETAVAELKQRLREQLALAEKQHQQTAEAHAAIKVLERQNRELAHQFAKDEAFIAALRESRGTEVDRAERLAKQAKQAEEQRLAQIAKEAQWKSKIAKAHAKIAGQEGKLALAVQKAEAQRNDAAKKLAVAMQAKEASAAERKQWATVKHAAEEALRKAHHDRDQFATKAKVIIEPSLNDSRHMHCQQLYSF
jgi:hypothetical protein